MNGSGCRQGTLFALEMPSPHFIRYIRTWTSGHTILNYYDSHIATGVHPVGALPNEAGGLPGPGPTMRFPPEAFWPEKVEWSEVGTQGAEGPRTRTASASGQDRCAEASRATRVPYRTVNRGAERTTTVSLYDRRAGRSTLLRR